MVQNNYDNEYSMCNPTQAFTSASAAQSMVNLQAIHAKPFEGVSGDNKLLTSIFLENAQGSLGVDGTTATFDKTVRYSYNVTLGTIPGLDLNFVMLTQWRYQGTNTRIYRTKAGSSTLVFVGFIETSSPLNDLSQYQSSVLSTGMVSLMQNTRDLLSNMTAINGTMAAIQFNQVPPNFGTQNYTQSVLYARTTSSIVQQHTLEQGIVAGPGMTDSPVFQPKFISRIDSTGFAEVTDLVCDRVDSSVNFTARGAANTNFTFQPGSVVNSQTLQFNASYLTNTQLSGFREPLGIFRMTYRVSVLSQINYPTVLNSMAQVRVEITSDVSPDGGVTIIPIQVRDLGFATIGSYTTLVTPTYVYSAEGSITFEALNTISNFRLVFPNCTDLTVASVATLKASVTIQNMSAQTSACSAPTTAIYVISPSSSLAFQINGRFCYKVIAGYQLVQNVNQRPSSKQEIEDTRACINIMNYLITEAGFDSLATVQVWDAVSNRIQAISDRGMHYGYNKVNWRHLKQKIIKAYDKISPMIGMIAPRLQPVLRGIEQARRNSVAFTPEPVTEEGDHEDILRSGDIEMNPGPVTIQQLVVAMLTTDERMWPGICQTWKRDMKPAVLTRETWETMRKAHEKRVYQDILRGKCFHPAEDEPFCDVVRANKNMPRVNITQAQAAMMTVTFAVPVFSVYRGHVPLSQPKYGHQERGVPAYVAPTVEEPDEMVKLLDEHVALSDKESEEEGLTERVRAHPMYVAALRKVPAIKYTEVEVAAPPVIVSKALRKGLETGRVQRDVTPLPTRRQIPDDNTVFERGPRYVMDKPNSTIMAELVSDTDDLTDSEINGERRVKYEYPPVPEEDVATTYTREYFKSQNMNPQLAADYLQRAELYRTLMTPEPQSKEERDAIVQKYLGMVGDRKPHNKELLEPEDLPGSATYFSTPRQEVMRQHATGYRPTPQVSQAITNTQPMVTPTPAESVVKRKVAFKTSSKAGFNPNVAGRNSVDYRYGRNSTTFVPEMLEGPEYGEYLLNRQKQIKQAINDVQSYRPAKGARVSNIFGSAIPSNYLGVPTIGTGRGTACPTVYFKDVDGEMQVSGSSICDIQIIYTKSTDVIIKNLADTVVDLSYVQAGAVDDPEYLENCYIFTQVSIMMQQRNRQIDQQFGLIVTINAMNVGTPTRGSSCLMAIYAAIFDLTDDALYTGAIAWSFERQEWISDQIIPGETLLAKQDLAQRCSTRLVVAQKDTVLMMAEFLSQVRDAGDELPAILGPT